MNTNDDMSIYEFEEKPKQPKSTKASMGIYIFKYDVLKKYGLVQRKCTISTKIYKDVLIYKKDYRLFSCRL